MKSIAECRRCGAIRPEFDARGLEDVLRQVEGYDFDDQRRRRTLRFQLRSMERIRDEIVMTLDHEDAERWIMALEPLTERLACELALQEGTGTMGAIFAVFTDHRRIRL